MAAHINVNFDGMFVGNKKNCSTKKSSNNRNKISTSSVCSGQATYQILKEIINDQQLGKFSFQ